MLDSIYTLSAVDKQAAVVTGGSSGAVTKLQELENELDCLTKALRSRQEILERMAKRDPDRKGAVEDFNNVKNAREEFLAQNPFLNTKSREFKDYLIDELRSRVPRSVWGGCMRAAKATMAEDAEKKLNEGRL